MEEYNKFNTEFDQTHEHIGIKFNISLDDEDDESDFNVKLKINTTEQMMTKIKNGLQLRPATMVKWLREINDLRTPKIKIIK